MQKQLLRAGPPGKGEGRSGRKGGARCRETKLRHPRSSIWCWPPANSALPVVRCLLFIFWGPELPLSQCPCLALGLRPHFHQASATLGSSPLSCCLLMSGSVGREGGRNPFKPFALKPFHGICVVTSF